MTRGWKQLPESGSKQSLNPSGLLLSKYQAILVRAVPDPGVVYSKWK